MADRARRGRVRVRWSADATSAARGGITPAGSVVLVLAALVLIALVLRVTHLA